MQRRSTIASLNEIPFDAAVVECKPSGAEEIHACSEILRLLGRLPIISLIGDLVVTDREALDRDVLRAMARLLGEDVPNRRALRKSPRSEPGRLFGNEKDSSA